MPLFLVGLVEAIFRFFGDKAKKIAFFSVYCGLLLAVMTGVKDFAMNHTNFSSFMTPTICFFFTKLKAFEILSTYFAFISANWIKTKVVNFWTYGSK